MKLLTALMLCGLMVLPNNGVPMAPADNSYVDKQRNKVIFDTDPLMMCDDTYCLCALLQADAAGLIDLLGCTSVGGNATAAETTMALLRTLELVGRGDVPVYKGTDIPLLGLHDNEFFAQRGMFYLETFQRLNEYGRHMNYKALPEKLFSTPDWNGFRLSDFGYSKLSARETAAAQFMVEQVKKYPNEITIVAAGPCMNVATACMLDPTFAENTKGIIYMGGAVDVMGNVTNHAEYNWYYDAAAVQACISSPFPMQTVVPHDISFNLSIDKSAVNKLRSTDNTLVSELFTKHGKFEVFDEDEKLELPVWDLALIVPLLAPELITRSDTRKMLVETSYGPEYGAVQTWKTNIEKEAFCSFAGPSYAPEVQIIYDVDDDAFWTFVAKLYGQRFN